VRFVHAEQVPQARGRAHDIRLAARRFVARRRRVKGLLHHDRAVLVAGRERRAILLCVALPPSPRQHLQQQRQPALAP